MGSEHVFAVRVMIQSQDVVYGDFKAGTAREAFEKAVERIRQGTRVDEIRPELWRV